MADFSAGELVRCVGLKKTEFNHHVGRVVSFTEQTGRIGVALHRALFEDRHMKREYPPISFKPENLRHAKIVKPNNCFSVLDSVPTKIIERTFGELGWGLPNNIVEHIAAHLCIQSVLPSDVSVIGCSSHRGDFPISAAMTMREDEWWISAAGSMPGGIGSEYLEFSLNGMRRVSYVGIKIPPLPNGPLSVRDFHLLALRPELHWNASDPDAWVAVSPVPLQTLDRGDLQEFAMVPPVEAERIRLVCTRNAAAAAEDDMGLWRRATTDCIGIFQVAFA